MLPDHYSWLAGVAPEHTDAGWTDSAEALSVAAHGTGSAELTYRPGRDDLPITRPAEDLLLAMFFVDDEGEVRWARRVPLDS